MVPRNIDSSLSIKNENNDSEIEAESRENVPPAGPSRQPGGSRGSRLRREANALFGSSALASDAASTY